MQWQNVTSITVRPNNQKLSLSVDRQRSTDNIAPIRGALSREHALVSVSQFRLESEMQPQ